EPIKALVGESMETQTARPVSGTVVSLQAEVDTEPDEPPSVSTFSVGGGDCVLVATIDEAKEIDFFDAESLRTLRRVINDLENLPQVRSILWLDNIPEFNLFGLSGTLLPSDNASPRRLAMARERVLANPLAVGQFISDDARTLLLHVNLDWFHVRSDDDASFALSKAAQRSAGETSPIEFLITGQVPLYAMTAKNHVTDSTKYQVIGYSIMMIAALVLFRGISAVLIVAAAPATGVFWTMGMLHFFDLQDNPFNDTIVPVMTALVGLTDSVHLMSEIRQQRASGLETRQAYRRGVARVGLACLLTSVTTAIGFLSLMYAHHEIVQQFGKCCVVGITMTFVSVLTVTPLGCRSPLGKKLHVGIGKSLIDGQLQRLGPIVGWVVRHFRPMSLAAIVSTAALALWGSQLTPDEKRYSGLSESGEPARALRLLDRELGGLEFGYVRVSWSVEQTDVDVLGVLEQSEKLLRSEPLIGNPIGLQSLLKVLPGDGDAAERMSLLELLPPSLKRAFYIPEYRYAWIQFRVQDRGIAAYGPPFEHLEAAFEEMSKANPGFRFQLDGEAVYRWRNVYQIVTDLAKSLGTASIVIWIVLSIVYRSLRIGLISIIPNVFPLVATASVLVFWGQHLEIVTVCVFTICLGIAVDDTIHFLTRYQEESREGGEHEEVISRAFAGVGSALLMTTLVLVTGMGSAILGDSRDARMFGIMGCLTLATALFADIAFLPALLRWFDAKKQPRESHHSSQET
ncbi:MAG: MMPL family transporter, partial [Planctomycetota bacterium]